MAVRWLGTVLAVALAAAGAAGGTWWITNGDPAPLPGGSPVASVAGAQLDRSVELQDAAAAARSSLLRVQSASCGVSRQGTATLIRTDGQETLLTNRHVVAGTSAASAVSDDGTVWHLQVESLLRGRDAAVLSPAERNVEAGVSFAAAPVEGLEVGPVPQRGSKVVVAGFPGGRYSAREGTVVGIERRHGYGGEAEVLLVDVDAEAGLSGGVVLDSSGRAVGLVAARDPRTADTVAYAIGALAVARDPGPAPC